MPVASQAASGASRLPLLALASASFAIGTTEFVIMGLLPDVAQDLAVSIPRAGLLVTGYALSVALGSPFLAIATARMDRRRALLLLVSIFICGNLLCAIAPSYGLLMVSRILTALSHGAFFGLGAVIATALVPTQKKSQAIAMMFAGLTLANVLGVPFGTALGEALGWRDAFWAVAIIGVVAALALYVWLPRNLGAPRVQLLEEARCLRSSQVLLAMLISILSSASLFSVFTYITPFLEQVTHLSPHAVTLMLFLFGVGLTVGNVIGGRLGDWKLIPSVIGILASLVLVLILFTITTASPLPAAVTIFCWGLLAFALISPLQMRVVSQAVHAPNLASTLNQGAFNLGNATGAWVGGFALNSGLTYDDLPHIGAAIAVAALALSVYSQWLERRTRSHHMIAAPKGRLIMRGSVR
jgi:MFS transporter, DHA1 family, inner membrane transport protein